MANKPSPRFILEIEAPANGRVHKATVLALDEKGKVQTTTCANLLDHAERKKVVAFLAQKLQTDSEQLHQQLETAWNDALDQRRQQQRQAAAGSPEAATEEQAELLDAAPPRICRPLCLVGDHAYAAAWVPTRIITRSLVEAPTGAQTNPSLLLERTEDRLLIVTDEGKLYADGVAPGAQPLSVLRMSVCLPFAPPPGRGWSGSGVKRFLAGERPEPVETFRQLTMVINHFLDFHRSLADQETTCELVACYVLATYLLDAFPVVGYLWPYGERGSGKTRFLHVVAETAYLGQVILSGSSYPCLRDFADYGATLAFDEAEALLDKRQADPDKRALLLAGNYKGAVISVKELQGDRWVMRHVHTFCPRLFSALKTPDDVLGSRCIIVPLVRSLDPQRTKTNVLDAGQWPCDRQRLIDDLWVLGLTNLRLLPAHDRAAAALMYLTGRTLDPWRPILAVAHCLQERYGLTRLFQRMQQVATNYQKERAEYEAEDRVRLLLRALLRLTAGGKPDEPRSLFPKEIAQEMNELAQAEDLVDENREFTNPKRVGWLLRRLRLVKPSPREEQGKSKEFSRKEVESLAQAFGVIENEPQALGTGDGATR
jgi:hypothetical protein